MLMQGSLLSWTLEPSHLAQSSLHLPPGLLSAGCTALAGVTDTQLIIGDGQGGIWEVQVGWLHTMYCICTE